MLVFIIRVEKRLKGKVQFSDRTGNVFWWWLWVDTHEVSDLLNKTGPSLFGEVSNELLLCDKAYTGQVRGLGFSWAVISYKFSLLSFS